VGLGVGLLLGSELLFCDDKTTTPKPQEPPKRVFQIREIPNVFSQLDPKFRCFGCGQSNKLGLKLALFADDEGGFVFSRVKVPEDLTEFPNVVHGGILSTVMDEVAFWAVFEKTKKIPITVKMQIDYARPVRPNTRMEVRAKVEKTEGRNLVVRVLTFNEEGQECASGKIHYLLASRIKMEMILGKEQVFKLQNFIYDYE